MLSAVGLPLEFSFPLDVHDRPLILKPLWDVSVPGNLSDLRNMCKFPLQLVHVLELAFLPRVDHSELFGSFGLPDPQVAVRAPREHVGGVPAEPHRGEPLHAPRVVNLSTATLVDIPDSDGLVIGTCNYLLTPH